MKRIIILSEDGEYIHGEEDHRNPRPLIHE